MALGKESIKRAANTNIAVKEEKIAVKTTEKKEKPIKKRTVSKEPENKPELIKNTEKVEVISNIKSDLPTYLL